MACQQCKINKVINGEIHVLQTPNYRMILKVSTIAVPERSKGWSGGQQRSNRLDTTHFGAIEKIRAIQALRKNEAI